MPQKVFSTAVYSSLPNLHTYEQRVYPWMNTVLQAHALAFGAVGAPRPSVRYLVSLIPRYTNMPWSDTRVANTYRQCFIV